MRISEEILLTLVMKNAVATPALLLLGKSERSTYRAIDNLKKKGYITEEEYTLEGFINKYYKITAEGLRTLMAKPPEGHEWLSYIDPEDIDKHFSVIGSDRTNADQRDGFLRKTTSAIMAELAGAEQSLMFIADGEIGLSADNGYETVLFNDDDHRLAVIARRAYYEYQEDHPDQRVKPDRLRYVPSQVIKGLLKNAAGEYDRFLKSRDLDRGRFTGFLESSRKIVICYVLPKHGMNWTKTSEKYERMMAGRIKTAMRKNRTILQSELRAVIFVKNAKAVAKLFADDNEETNY